MKMKHYQEEQCIAYRYYFTTLIVFLCEEIHRGTHGRGKKSDLLLCLYILNTLAPLSQNNSSFHSSLPLIITTVIKVFFSLYIFNNIINTKHRFLVFFPFPILFISLLVANICITLHIFASCVPVCS